MDVTQRNPETCTEFGGRPSATAPEPGNLVIENLSEFATAGVVSYTGSSIADFIIREPQPMA